MNTLHRKDICSVEFRLLAGFCRALQVLEDGNGRLPWVLGEVEMWLPVWYLAGNGWQLSTYRPFVREAFGIETRAMRRICRYLRVNEAQLIGTLYRLSMLAVVPGQGILEPPRFRMSFFGIEIDYEGVAPPMQSHGFVIERRRAEGKFRPESSYPSHGSQG